MKIKYISVIILIILCVFLIYIFNLDTKIYYLNIEGQDYKYKLNIKDKISKNLENYVNISSDDYRITDLLRDIDDNKKINENQTIQNALIKADIITIKMGDNELNYKINTSKIEELFGYCDELIIDLDNLFKKIRSYSKEDIYFLGFYNNHSQYYDEIYEFINLRLKDICDNYKIKFIDVGNLDLDKENIKIADKIK